MEAQKLDKTIRAKAENLGVTQIELRFQGGSDEGYLHVEVVHPEVTWQTRDDPDKQQLRTEVLQLAEDVEKWAWEVYSYSGAGDGSDYGDDIIYNLKEGVVETSEWYQEVKYSDPVKMEMS